MAITKTKAKQKRELAHYFEYSNHGIQVVSDGLQEITFGEFLIEHTHLTRSQLFNALQMQDRKPKNRIGECVATLGYLPFTEIERQLRSWENLDTVLV